MKLRLVLACVLFNLATSCAQRSQSFKSTAMIINRDHIWCSRYGGRRQRSSNQLNVYGQVSASPKLSYNCDHNHCHHHYHQSSSSAIANPPNLAAVIVIIIVMIIKTNRTSVSPSVLYLPYDRLVQGRQVQVFNDYCRNHNCHHHQRRRNCYHHHNQSCSHLQRCLYHLF